MKVKLLILAICFGGVLSCTQKTCPTYLKDDVSEKEKTEERV